MDLARTAVPMADARGGAAGREEPSCAGRETAALPGGQGPARLPLLGGRTGSSELGGGGGSELGGGPPSPAMETASSLRGHGGSTPTPPSLLSLAAMAGCRIRPGPCWPRWELGGGGGSELEGGPPSPAMATVSSLRGHGGSTPTPPSLLSLAAMAGPPDPPGAMLAAVEARAGPAAAVAAVAVEARAGHGG